MSVSLQKTICINSKPHCPLVMLLMATTLVTVAGIKMNVLVIIMVTQNAKKPTNSKMLRQVNAVSGVLCQKRVSRAGTSDYIPQILWDLITCPYPWYLHLAQHSSFNIAAGVNAWSLIPCILPTSGITKYNTIWIWSVVGWVAKIFVKNDQKFLWAKMNILHWWSIRSNSTRS